MARYAQVHTPTGFVVNVVEWDGNTDPATGGWVPPDGYTMVVDEPPTCGPGWTYDGSKFTPPPGGQTPQEPAA